MLSSLQSYVREQILQTVAVLLKRGTLESKGANLDSLFGDVTQLISSGNVTMVGMEASSNHVVMIHNQVYIQNKHFLYPVECLFLICKTCLLFCKTVSIPCTTSNPV